MTKELPQHWIKTTLGEISLKPQYGWTSKTASKGDLRYLRTSDISTGKVNWKTVPFCEKEPYFKEDFLIKKGDILISRSGTIGISYLVEEIPFDCVFASYLIRFQPTLVNRKYIYYFLQSNFYWNAVLQDKGGVSIPNVNAKQLSALEIPLPPRKEQNKIVQTLDTLFTKLDLFKRRLENIPKLLKAYKNLVLRNAITGDLTKGWRQKNQNKLTPVELGTEDYSINTNFKEQIPLPTKWSWVALGNYAKCKRGKFSARPRNDPQFYDGKYPFIQIGDLPKNGGFIHSHKQTLNKRGLGVSKLFSKNTIAIAIVGATIGNTGILDYDMCFPDSLIGIDTEIDYSNFFIEYYLRQEKNNLREISYSSGGQPNIKLPIIKSYPLPLPPLEEQKEIVKRVDNLFKKANMLENYYLDALLYFENINKVILQKAFTGELVKPVNDETTVVELLENIKIENEKLETEIREIKRERPKVKKMKPTNKNIYDVLKTSKKTEMLAKEVWKKSKYRNDIEKFYKNLRDEIETKKRVRETKVVTGEGSVLSLR